MILACDRQIIFYCAILLCISGLVGGICELWLIDQPLLWSARTQLFAAMIGVTILLFPVCAAYATILLPFGFGLLLTAISYAHAEMMVYAVLLPAILLSNILVIILDRQRKALQEQVVILEKAQTKNGFSEHDNSRSNEDITNNLESQTTDRLLELLDLLDDKERKTILLRYSGKRVLQLKEVGHEMSLAEVTIKTYRSTIRKKMREYGSDIKELEALLREQMDTRNNLNG
ncbi:MAG: hypothetical protein R8L53_05485 [Mariprofundales bacterium]